MRWFHKLPLRFRSVFRRGSVEEELNAELRFHLEQMIEAKVATGMSAEEARYAALRELGGVEQIKEECRDMRRVSYLENFLQDVRPYWDECLTRRTINAAAARVQAQW